MSRHTVISSFEGGKKLYGDKMYVEIFKNPTLTEMKALVPRGYDHYIRFIIFPKTKELYLFNGELLHDYALETVGREHEKGYTISGGGWLTTDHKKINNIDIEGHLLLKYNPRKEEWLQRWLSFS